MTRFKFVAAGLSAAALSLVTLASAGVAMAASTPSPHVTHVSHHHARRTTRKTTRRHYEVQDGDSMWSIAHRFNADWYNLAADNNLQMYAVLHPGMTLVLPRRGEQPHAPMPLTPGGTAAGQSSVPAATTSTTSSVAASTPSSDVGTGATSSFEQCVISRESGGNADATNGGGYWGLFQFSPSTWAAYGGSPADFGSASAAQQEQVFNNAMARGGESNWAPYDGC